MDKRHYAHLLDSLMKGEASEEEKNFLSDWLNTSGSEEEIRSLYKERWENASNILDEEIQLKMLRNIHSRIDNKMQVKARSRKKISLYAAAACIAFAMIVGTYFFAQEWVSPKEFVVTTGKEQRTSFALPDGTMVWLNANSKLQYDSKYNKKKRQVMLEGEAYFDVAKNKNRRFIVSVNDLDVEALGTSFNVRSYTENEDVLVALVEGKLRVSNMDTARLLHPNERLTFNKRDKSMRVDDQLSTVNEGKWRYNELYFNEESLETIAKTLTRMYDVEFLFTSESVKQHTFSGSIKNDSLMNVLEIISLAAPIQYSVEDDVVKISDTSNQ